MALTVHLSFFQMVFLCGLYQSRPQGSSWRTAVWLLCDQPSPPRPSGKGACPMVLRWDTLCHFFSYHLCCLSRSFSLFFWVISQCIRDLSSQAERVSDVGLRQLQGYTINLEHVDFKVFQRLLYRLLSVKDNHTNYSEKFLLVSADGFPLTFILLVNIFQRTFSDIFYSCFLAAIAQFILPIF